MSPYHFSCPQCNREDLLHVHVLATAHLVQEPDGNIQTEVFGDHEWDATYTMWCDCGCTGMAAEFTAGKIS